MKKDRTDKIIEGIVVRDPKPLTFIRQVGRPIKFTKETPKLTEKYITRCVKVGMIPTMEGLAGEFGVVPETLQEWKKPNQRRLVKAHKEFSISTRNLMAKQSEMMQWNGLTGAYSTPMAIFLLKNNHGFKDKHEVDHTTEGERIKNITYTVPIGAETQDPPDPTDPVDPE